jgi:glycosyltransferase involved in cell wall biosynthesis
MISVLMATFNGEAFVEEAIASVLGQRGVQLELIVTDDGSTDATASIVRALARRDARIQLAVQPHAGVAASRNACVARARGSYLAFLDQDDRCPGGKLARQRTLLEASPELGAVFGRTQMFDSVREQAPGYTMLLSAALLRRETVEAIGRFDPEYASADDFDFLLRMIEQGHRIELETGLGVSHRRHPDQVSADLEATRRDCVRALARSLQRRRRAGTRGPLQHPLMTGAVSMTESYGVVIPAYNAARTLSDAIKSVLAQTVPPRSVVVIDDGSTDATAAIARSFGAAIRLITQDNRGAAAATDRGFAELSEPLWAGLDADDVWRPDKAARQLAELTSDPGLDAVFCRARIFDHGTRPGPDAPEQDLWGRSAMLIRRSAAERIGRVDAGPAARSGEMIDWLARGRERGLRFRLAPIALVDRRRIPGSASDGQDASALLPAVRAALERKRAAPHAAGA